MAAGTFRTVKGLKLLMVDLGPAEKYNYDRNLAVKHADGVARRILGKHCHRVWATNSDAAYTLTVKDKRKKKQGWV